MRIFAFFSVIFATCVFAQNLPQQYLAPGASKVYYDYSTQQATQVICMGQPQPPPAFIPSCQLRYNPANNSCTQYVIYSDNSPISRCLGNLNQVQHSLNELYASGSCARPIPSACMLKYNPLNNSCTNYVIYLNNAPITGCLGSMSHDVMPVKAQLVRMGVCLPN